MPDLKIITLSENTTNKRGLIAQHGLSLLIDYKGYQVLFDTGPGASVTANAKELAVNLKDIHCIVLSHGHDDHTGGLLNLLRKSGAMDIYTHPNALKPKYKFRKQEQSYESCGIPNSREELKNAGAHFVYNTKARELTPGLWLTGEIPRVTDFEPLNETHYVEEGNEYVLDSMVDDQALVAITKNGPVVITGCAHSGLINTLLHAANIANSKYIYGLVGGTHLHNASAQRLERTIEALNTMGIQRLAVSHCTGFNAQMAFYNAFQDKFILNNAGNVLEF